jgi:hypothetical protein
VSTGDAGGEGGWREEARGGRCFLGGCMME